MNPQQTNATCRHGRFLNAGCIRCFWGHWINGHNNPRGGQIRVRFEK